MALAALKALEIFSSHICSKNHLEPLKYENKTLQKKALRQVLAVESH